MQKYYYSLINSSFKINKGIIYAQSQTDAAIKLNPNFILSIKTPFSLTNMINNKNSFWHSFFINFSSLINNGFTISSALDLMIKEEIYKNNRKALSEINRSILNGHSLSYALLQYDYKIPHKNYILPLIKQAERGGYLGETLKDINNLFEEKKYFSDSLKNSLIHPLVLISAFFAFFILINTVIIPQFNSVLTQLGHTINPLLNIFILFNKILMISCFIAPFSFFVLYKTNKYSHIILNIIKNMPLIKSLYQKIVILSLFKNLSLLLKRGFSIGDSLSIIHASSSSKYLTSKVAYIQKSIKTGETFSKAVKILDGLPRFSFQLIYISEKNSSLPDTLLYISKTLEKEIKQSITRLTKLIEPLIIIILGIWLLTAILLIFSPLFQSIQNISYR